jgi:hypothetical protein
MDDEFVPYEESKALYDLGYDEPFLGRFRAPANRLVYGFELTHTPSHVLGVIAPLYQQAFRWFMDIYGLYVEPFVDDNEEFGFMVTYFIPLGRTDMPVKGGFKTPKERDLACIRFLIETVKSGKKKRV